MLVSLTRRWASSGAVAALLLALAAMPGHAQSEVPQGGVEGDPVLGPLLDSLMEAPGSATGNGAADAAESLEPADVAGFRAARFGMTEAEVLSAIEQDFGIAEADVLRETNALERTHSLIALVDDLLPDSGRAAVVYIMGYQTGQLIQVNVIWGAPVAEDYRGQDLLVTGRQLQGFFAGRRYAEGSVFRNVMLSDGTLVMFTGADETGRQVTLSLVTRQMAREMTDAVAEPAAGSDPAAAAGGTEATAGGPADSLRLVPVALRVSYVQDPANPDIFTIDPGSF